MSRSLSTPLTRRQWIGVTASSGALAVASYGRWVEPNLAFISHHTIGTKTAASPLRLVQLSDLHLRDIAHHEHDIAQRVLELRANVLLLTGDVIDDGANLHLADSFLSLIGGNVPKIAILGNWEYWGRVDLNRLRTIYEKHGTQLLRNGSTIIRHGERSLLVLGLDDYVGGTPDLRRTLFAAETSPNILLLEHCPAYRDGLARPGSRAVTIASGLRPTLMLSGHTHGGQIAPFGWAPWRPYGSGRYMRGWYDAEGADVPRMYVSRGLGTSIIPMRIWSPPEIAVFDWYLA